MSYLNFSEETSLSGKTKVVTVSAVVGAMILGKIKWYSHWRRYCFFPNSVTVFDHECLEDIGWEIDRLQSEREDRKQINEEELSDSRSQA